MAADDCFMIFHGLKIRVKIVEPEGIIKNRIFILSSPLTSAFNWRKVTPEFQQSDCLTAIMDLPGFGESACGEGVPQNASLHAKVAWGVLDEIDYALGAHTRAWHLIGHGAACHVILAMGNLNPDDVCSQVFLSPTLAPNPPFPIGKIPKARWYDENIASPSGFRAFMNSLFARRMDDYILDSMRRPFLREGAKASFLMMLSQRPQPQPARGFHPAMALWGGQDILMDAQAKGALRALIPEAETHVLKTAGHIPMETHSHALRDYLRGWLKYVG